MTLQVEDTSRWPEERIAAHGPQITACLRKYVEALDGETTLLRLFEDIVSGRRVLWVLLDDDDTVKSSGLSEIHETDAGIKACRICALGGEGALDEIEFVGLVEEWAKERGAVKMQFLAKPGIARALRTYGYTAPLMMVEKALT